MNRLFRYALIAFGECILIAIMLLLFSQEERELMLLDTVVLSIVYLVNVFGYPSLVKQEDANETAGYGLAWLGTWIYSAAVLLAVILFYWIHLSIIWQVVIHCILLFFFLSAMYWASVATKYAGGLEQKYKSDARSIKQLKLKAHTLQALLYDGMDEEIKREVVEIVERTGYLIPNNSVLSSTLEKQIDSLLDALSDAILTHRPVGDVSPLVVQCKAVLKQRMSLR